MVEPAHDYDTLNRLLDISKLSPSPAEAQGIYCALLAARVADAEQRWLGELLPPGSDGEGDTAACRRALVRIAADTRGVLEGEIGGFEPLLPAESASLKARALGVNEWVRGYLFGLALSAVDMKTLSAETREALDDFIEMTRMDLDALEDTEANEAALSEIVEFVKVAAMLVYEDMAARDAR